MSRSRRPAGRRRPRSGAELLLAGLATSADVVVVSGDGAPATVELRLEAEQPDPAAAAALAQEAAADDLARDAGSLADALAALEGFEPVVARLDPLRPGPRHLIRRSSPTPRARR